MIAEFRDDAPTLAILKHTNPCGVGQGANLREAWDKAFATDRQAPFGGIIAVNQPLDGACAEAIAEIFSEVIVAPEFSAEALADFAEEKKPAVVANREITVACAAMGYSQRGRGFIFAATAGFENHGAQRI